MSHMCWVTDFTQQIKYVVIHTYVVIVKFQFIFYYNVRKNFLGSILSIEFILISSGFVCALKNYDTRTKLFSDAVFGT